jgi:hypothetical protein
MKYINQMHAHAYILTCLFHLSTLGMISKLQSKYAIYSLVLIFRFFAMHQQLNRHQ